MTPAALASNLLSMSSRSRVASGFRWSLRSLGRVETAGVYASGVDTLAWSAYSDPSLVARERERIFARSWQYVGRLAQLGDGPGYFASRVGDLPGVITRDRDGVLRAFLNVCRHLGSVVARLDVVRC